MQMNSSALSIIIPARNEEETLPGNLADLQDLREHGHEVILVDGGSTDRTVAIARPLVDQCLSSTPGRALQMNQGASQASTERLVFLHADTRLPKNAAALICAGLAGSAWGRFDVCLTGRHPGLRWVARGMNWRSRLTGIATGDQAIFVRREVFRELGGFPELPLMEDIAFSKRLLGTYGPPLCLDAVVRSSGRRWESNGLLRTVLLMWTLRLGYFCGVSPGLLAKAYGYPSPSA